tara:strand:- start:130 stop:705 length:576 start_codon:yes stop_codon:yes gene_type:complete
MNPMSKFQKKNLPLHLAFMLDQLKHEGPLFFVGAHMFDDINAALELEALGWAVVYIEQGRELTKSSNIRWCARMTTRKERKAVHIAAYQAAHQAKVDEARAKRQAMTVLQKATESVREDGFRVACKGLGYKLKQSKHSYGVFYAHTNRKHVERLCDRALGYWPMRYRDELREEWLDAYRMGLDEVIGYADY